jgi:hypothetical protein
MRNDEEKRSTPDAAFLSKNKTALNHMMKSQENVLYLPSSIVENEVILLINSLAQRRNAGSANRRRMSELIVVNTNASVKKRKTKQTEKENVLIRTTEEIVVVAETRETKTDIAVTTAEMKRTTKKNERGTAIHPRRIAK